MDEDENKFRRPVARPVPVPVGPPIPYDRPNPSRELLDQVKEKRRFPEQRPGITVLAITKDSDNPDESEDAVEISADGTKLAVCDGVSASSLSSVWATALARSWVTNPPSSIDRQSILKWIQAPKQAWISWIKDVWPGYVAKNRQRLGMEPAQEQLIKDAQQETLEKGASTTFLGIQINRDLKTIDALAIGDACMILVHPNQTYESFPITDPTEFNDRPYQISTRDNEGRSIGEPKVKRFNYNPEDRLVLATDAMAKWLLETLATDPDLALSILKMTPEKFSVFVKQERSQRRLEVDDTTLVTVALGNSQARRPIAYPPPVPVK